MSRPCAASMCRRALTGMLLAVALAELVHAVTPDGFPNSLAMDHPPRGWRSWSAYGGDVNQQLIEKVMDAMAKKRAGGRSLADLGYTGADTRCLPQPARTQTPRAAALHVACSAHTHAPQRPA